MCIKARCHVFLSLNLNVRFIALKKIRELLFPSASPSGSMALKSTPCTCTASALALFIRRVAQIDLVSTVWHANHAKTLSVARRNISIFHPLQSQGTSHHGTINTISYAIADPEDSIP